MKKALKFLENLVPLVLSGEKTSTWRLFDDKDLSIGDELSFLEHGTGKEFARAKIVGIREKKLGEITDADCDGHERYANRDEMFETYRGYYGDKVTENTPVKIISFELLKSIRT